MTTQCIFPAEIICDILSRTSPIDVVRWRRVSKRFRDITHEPRIWRTLYVNARYTRPPGPFSTLAFENAFAKSAKLARTWTIRGLQTLSRVTVPFEGRVSGKIDLIDGRWFLVCQARRRFVLYDTSVEAETREPRVVWEQRARIIYWHKRLGMSKHGKCVVYVLMNTEGRSQTTLLEIQLNTQTGAPSSTASFHIPVFEKDPKFSRLWRGWAPQTCSRFIALKKTLVFDMETRGFYGFPLFRIARPATRFVVGPTVPRRFMHTIIPTNTHVILLRTMGTIYLVIQAFIVPDDQHPTENRNGILRLTHEGVFESNTILFSLIRSSVVDQQTSTVNVKLLKDSSLWMDNLLESDCISLTLESTSEDVSPISVRKEPVCMRRAAPSQDRNELGFCSVYYDISLDGYARGLFVWCASCMETTKACIMKFSIDTTGDRCMFVVGWPSDIEAESIEPLMDHWVCIRDSLVPVFDSMRGRLSYLSEDDDDNDHDDDNGHRSICVVDVK